MRARMIELSWSGLRVPAIAMELDCSQKTVRCWLHRFNRSGLQERSRIIALVKTVPPGRLRWEPVGELWAFDESGPPEWTLDSLATAAQAEGIEVGRSQVRRILLAEGVRWRRTRSRMRSKDPDFVPKGHGSSASTPTRPTVRQSSAPTSWGR
ncbi:helix-turn-helix domain-containing protein [Streptomyces phaeochromogenes]|uniref:helix-turn-helix domain-containing protein n=1 Tax=Streptomyces phaeochromogenes TaxID=1923 RepID=UPI003863FFBD|nr:helix-turn-helix domain-containing protein [Streptomyces phaeochromogenes]